MKTACFLFLIIGIGVFTCGPGYAGEPSGLSSQPEGHEKPATGDLSDDPAQGNQTRGKIDQTVGKHSSPEDDNHAAARNLQHGSIEKAMPAQGHVQDRPGPTANSHEVSREKPGANIQTGRIPANNLPQSGLSKVASAAKSGLVMNKIENHPEPPARLPISSVTTAPPSGFVRSRVAGTSSLAGSAFGSGKNSLAGINGTEMKRKF